MGLVDYLLNHRKLIILSLIGLAVLYLYTTFGLAITTVNSTPNNKEANVTFSDPSDTNSSTKFTAQPQKRYFSLVKRSHNQFKAESGGAYSGKVVSFGLLWVKTINVSIEPQKKSEAIGMSAGSCAVDNLKAGYVMYYRCNATSDFVNFTNDGRTYTATTSSSVPETNNTIIKPYLNGYLKAVLVNRQLILEGFQYAGGKISPSAVNSIDFSDSLSQEVVATDFSSMDSEKIATFNQVSGDLTMFDSLGSAGRKINLVDKLKKQSSNTFSLKLSGNKLVLISSQIVYEGEGNDITESKAPQNIFFIDFASGKILEEKSISKSLRVVSWSINESGDVVFYAVASKASDEGVYLATQKKIDKLVLPEAISAVACWKDPKNFYYILNNRDVMIYSLSDKSYRLAYSAGSALVVNIDCYAKELYVAYSPKGSSVTDPRFSFLKVSNAALGGTPIESVLPIGPGAAYEIDSAYSYRNTVYVNLINIDYYDPNIKVDDIAKLRPKNPQKIQDGALNFFKSQGVDVSKYKFEFSY